MQCRKGILPLAAWIMRVGAPVGALEDGSSHTPCVWGKSGFLLCQKIGLSDLQGEKSPFPSTTQLDLVSFLFLEVLYCDLSWPLTGHVKLEFSKPEELLNWRKGEVLDRVRGLGCQAAHYNADSMASAPPNKCKEQAFLSYPFYYSTCITGRHLGSATC